jgi:hypothetical protein
MDASIWEKKSIFKGWLPKYDYSNYNILFCILFSPTEQYYF